VYRCMIILNYISMCECILLTTSSKTSIQRSLPVPIVSYPVVLFVALQFPPAASPILGFAIAPE
jgi:hypothetical protein